MSHPHTFFILTLCAFALGSCGGLDEPPLRILSALQFDQSSCEPILNQQLTHGVMDVGLTNKYTLSLAVDNLSVQDHQIEEVLLRTTAPELSFTLPYDVTLPVAQHLPQNSTDALSIEVISPNLGNLMRTQATEFTNQDQQEPIKGASVTVVFEFQVISKDEQQNTHKSPWFSFPMDLCMLCLVDFSDARPPVHPETSSTCQPLEMETNAQRPCRMGSNTTVTCTDCWNYSIPSDAPILCEPPSK